MLITSFFKILFASIKVITKTDIKLSILLFVIVIFSSSLPVLSIRTSADILNKLILQSTEKELFFSLVQWGFVLLIYDLSSSLISFLQSNLGDKSVFYISKSIIIKANSLVGLKFFEEQRFFDDIQIISSNAHSRPINLVVTLVGIFKDFCVIAYCIILLFNYIHYFTIVMLLCVIIHTKISINIQSRMWSESLGRSMKSRKMAYISSISTSADYAKEFRMFSIGKYLLDQFEIYFIETYNLIFRLRLKLILWPLIPSIIILMCNVLILNNVIKSILNQSIAIGSIAIVIQCFLQLHSSALSYGEQSGWLTGHLLFFSKYFEFINRKEDEAFGNNIGYTNYKSITSIDCIEFIDVCFSYLDGRITLNNINFKINKSEKLAIIGANGSGKSTLIKLICGFYKPTSGKIIVNNLPIECYNIQNIRDLISPVFQDFCKYSLSIEENISMQSNLDQLRLNSVLSKVELDFISKLPKKLKEQLGKNFGGIDLSIGEWQRLAIARAIYKNGSLYILDEPTASLDPIMEYEIFNYFANISKNKMTIFVTHRLSSIKISNKILLLDKGMQLAFDSHENLINVNNLYTEMFNINFKNPIY